MSTQMIVSAGRVRLTRGDGSVSFDSDEALFHPIDRVPASGYGEISITWPFIPQAAAWDREQSYQIGACHPDATHVTGWFTTSGDTIGPQSMWRHVNGTYIHRVHGYNTYQSSEFGSIRHAVHYTFRCGGGVVYLDEVAHFSAYNNGGQQSALPVSLVPFTIRYKLICGIFI